MITGIYAGLAGLMLIYLSIRVIGIRRRTKISVGPAGDAGLERAMRVQGNFVEYTPLSLILMLAIELIGVSAIAIHAFGLTLIFSRVVHFLGFRSAEAPGIFRVGGMAMTFTLIAILSVLLIALSAGLK